MQTIDNGREKIHISRLHETFFSIELLENGDETAEQQIGALFSYSSLMYTGVSKIRIWLVGEIIIETTQLEWWLRITEKCLLFRLENC